jgi:hypothetical protein
MEFTRVFKSGTVDQQELLAILELLLNELPPAPSPTQTATFDRSESSQAQ